MASDAEETVETVDIPEPDVALPADADAVTPVDPGGDAPSGPPEQFPLGEDPAYDPGGTGRQPDVVEEDEEYR